MKKQIILGILSLVFIIMTVHELSAKKKKQKKVSVIESVNYDEKENTTTYMVFPYGSVKLDGKWKDIGDVASSQQKKLANENGVEMLVMINECRNFEFNIDSQNPSEDFVERFYQWEKEYFERNPNLKVNVIDQDTLENYIIYNITGTLDNAEINTIILIAEKNCSVKSLSIQKVQTQSREEKITLIKETFLNE